MLKNKLGLLGALLSGHALAFLQGGKPEIFEQAAGGASVKRKKKKADPMRQAAAIEKREDRCYRNLRHAARGAYGLRPFVGQQGYANNYPIASARGV